MATIRRIQYHRYGGPELMRLEEVEQPRPGAGEVLVRVKAAAANPMDWGIRGGGLKIMTGRSFPRGVGHDFAGVVEAVGEGVTRLKAGDAVMGGTSVKAAGAFADMAVAEEKAVVLKPEGLSFEEAAAVPTVGLTAYQAVVGKAGVRAGQAVFVHGCLGGVGRSAVQIAAMRGASVGGSCRPTAAQQAHDIGIDPVVAFDFDAAPLAGRFDLVLDTAGTLPAKAARTLLRPGGTIVDINPTPAKLAKSALPGPFHVLIAQPVTEDLEAVARAAGEGALRLPIVRTVPLAEAIEALTELEVHGTPKGGKLVVVTE